MSETIYLRPLTIEDANISYHWRNDKSLWQYTGNRPDREITPEIEKEWAEKVIADKTRANFAIMLGNQYIGNIYLVNIKDNTAELGIVIGERSAHGKGYGQQALNLLIKEARVLCISVIYIIMNPHNIPALITYLKCGAKLPDSYEGGNLILTLTV